MVVFDTNDIVKRKLLVLYVGGTIGMQKEKQGVYVPVPDEFVKFIKSDPQMHDEEIATKLFPNLKNNELILPAVENVLIRYEIKEYSPLLDSSYMSPEDWIRIAKDIGIYYNEYDGFVILHGTDTLTYTSSALSFMLDGLNKSVILTGAQIPIYQMRSDAKDNFLVSLMLAGCYNIPEVGLYFANSLYRGNRTTKVSANLLDAFKSVNYHPLASVDITISVNRHYVRVPNKDEQFKVNTNLCKDVGLLHFFPTITASMIESFLKPPVQGLVLQSYGAGNIPSREDILDVFSKAVERGVIIVNVTQCPHGTVTKCYEPAKKLEDIGIICGQDMTAEAALTKLCFVLGQDVTHKKKIQMMKTDMRGELTSRKRIS